MTQLHRRKLLQLGLAVGTVGPLWTRFATAQGVPDVARIVVGVPAGGSPDVISRMLAERLTGKLAKSVIVDNRPGAGGRIAADNALQAPADGTTLLFNPAGVLTIHPHVYKKMSYDPFRDFAPVSLVSTFNFAFGVGAAVPVGVKNLAQFASWLKENPSKAAYGSPAAGTPPHFVGHAISESLGLGMTHVPYKGGAPAVSDLLGGQLTSLVMTEGDFLQHVRAGRARVIAISGTERSLFYPEVQTLAAQNVKGLEHRDWYGLYIAGKPTADVVGRVGDALRPVLTSREFIAAIHNIGFEAKASSPQELDQMARSDFKRWEPLIKATGFQGD